MADIQLTLFTLDPANKVCTLCSVEKSIEAFPRRKRLNDYAHENRCKECKYAQGREYHAKWRAKPENKARMNARSAQWRIDNLEREKELNRKWRSENRDRKNATTKAWYESVGKQRIDPVKRQAANVRWREANPERYRELSVVHANIRRSRVAGVQVVDFSVEQLSDRLDYYGRKCWICKEAPYEHLDHVKPISKGGAHMLSNLRPACAKCNLSKKDKWPLEVS